MKKVTELKKNCEKKIKIFVDKVLKVRYNGHIDYKIGAKNELHIRFFWYNCRLVL